MGSGQDACVAAKGKPLISGCNFVSGFGGRVCARGGARPIVALSSRCRWTAVSTGTRKSTYANPEFLKTAVFAEAEKKAIDSSNPNDSTLPKSPYVGVQFAIGIAVGQQMSAALSGKSTVDAALKASQAAADREMRKGGYYK
jgi:ABC-type glycerol-3-phosphate transport system substrate-binding protein